MPSLSAKGIHHLYARLKRNKALPDIQGLGVAVLDGHESHASYRRHCRVACSAPSMGTPGIALTTTPGR